MLSRQTHEDCYASILKPRSISEAGIPPRTPQFSGGVSRSVIFDIRWRNIERREIADDGLIKSSLGSHRSAGKHRDFDEGKFLAAARRDRKVRRRMFDQTQRSIRFGNFQGFSKSGLSRIDHRAGIGDPASARSDHSVGQSRLYAALAGGSASTE